MDSGRRHFLFGITVSEIAFILFFILLLFSFFSIAKLQKENTSEKAGREQASAEAAAANEELDIIGEAFGFGEGADIDLDAALTALKEGARAIKKAEEQRQQLQELKAENEKLRQQEASAKNEAAQTEKNLTITKGQLAYMVERAAVGDPPCWVVDESGEIEYLFNIELFSDETVRVRREAPDHRNADYRAFPSVPEITSRRLRMAEFERLSLPIYLLGEQSDPQCRHFVRLKFADQAACRLFLKVEKYFYKSVLPSDQSVCS